MGLDIYVERTVIHEGEDVKDSIYAEEVGYWRKNYSVMHLMEDFLDTPIENCQLYRLDPEGVKEILSMAIDRLRDCVDLEEETRIAECIKEFSGMLPNMLEDYYNKEDENSSVIRVYYNFIAWW